MGNVKQINARFQHKHDTPENWAKAINFVPYNGEIIIYDEDPINHTKTQMKIGDGIRSVIELPFVNLFENLSPGAGVDSIIQEASQDEYDKSYNIDVTNFAISPATAALGKANYAGSMGYVIDPSTFDIARDYYSFMIQNYEHDNGFAVGDTVTLKIGNSFDEWAKITQIQDKTKKIVVSGLDEEPIFDGIVDSTDPSTDCDFSFIGVEVSKRTMFYIDTDYSDKTKFRVKVPESVYCSSDGFLEIDPFYENDVLMPVEIYYDYNPGQEDDIHHHVKIYKVIGYIVTETVNLGTQITIDKPVNLNTSNINKGKQNEGTIRCTAKPLSGNIQIDACQFTAGEDNIAAGWAAASLGGYNKSVGRYAFTAGAGNTAVYSASALGYYNKALGHNSHAQNRENIASGENSTAMGLKTKAIGRNSLAIGSETEAKGERSFAGGYKTKAEGTNAVALGSASSAKFNESFAFGHNVHAGSNFETVVGKNNLPTDGALFTVGAGSGTTGEGNGAKYNALQVLDTGAVRLGKTPTHEMDAAPLKTVQTVKNELTQLINNKTAANSKKIGTIENTVQDLQDSNDILKKQTKIINNVLTQIGAVTEETRHSENNLVEVPEGCSSFAFIDKIAPGIKSSNSLEVNTEVPLGYYNAETDGASIVSQDDTQITFLFDPYYEGSPYYINIRFTLGFDETEFKEGDTILIKLPKSCDIYGSPISWDTVDEEENIFSITIPQGFFDNGQDYVIIDIVQSTSYPKDYEGQTITIDLDLYAKVNLPQNNPIKPTGFISHSKNILPSLQKASIAGSTLVLNEPKTINGAVFTYNPDGTISVDGVVSKTTIINKTGLNIPIPKTGLYIFSNTFIKTQVGLSNSTVGSATLNNSTTNKRVGSFLRTGTNMTGNLITTGQVIRYSIEMVAGEGNCIIKPLISFAETDYVPYEESTVYEIPDSIKNLKGYCECNPQNASQYNYIDGEAEEFVQVGYFENNVWKTNNTPVRIPIDFNPVLPMKNNSGFIELITDTGDDANISITFQFINKGV